MLTTPTTPGSQPTPALTRRRFSARNIFEHLAKLSAKALRSQPRRIRKKLIEPRSLQRADAELGKDFLLTHAVMKGVQKGICSLGCGFGFDDGWIRPIGGRHRIGYAASYASRTLWFFPANLCRRAQPRQSRGFSPIVC